MKKCLWVVPKAIFPVKDGARVANQALLKSIRPYFNEMDILIFSDNISDNIYLNSYHADFSPTEVYFIKRLSTTNLFTKLLSLGLNYLKSPHLPVTTGPFHSGSIKNVVNKILSGKKYDLIVFDGLHPYIAFKGLTDFENTPVVYRAHNVEGDLWLTAAAKVKNILVKKLLLWQGEKMRNLEANLIDRSQRVWNIAEEDLEKFKKMYHLNNEKLDLVPVGLNFKSPEVPPIFSTRATIKLLFLGKMDWAPNKDGLKWFLEEVWPSIDYQKMELIIVGSGDARWGAELFKKPGVKFLGYVEDLNPIYADSDFSIIPIRYGSGTRIKVIESISKKIPIISTRMGVQGSGLKDFFLAEAKEDWIQTLNTVDLEEGRKLAATAFFELEKMYSPKSIGEKAFHSLHF